MEELSDVEELSEKEDLAKNPNLSEVEPFIVQPKKETFLEIQIAYKDNVQQEKRYVANTAALKKHEIELMVLKNKIDACRKSIKNAEKGITDTNKYLINKLIDTVLKTLSKTEKDNFESELACKHAVEKSLLSSVDIDFVNQQIIMSCPQNGLGQKK